LASSCDLEREDGRGCLLCLIGLSHGAVPGKLGLGKLLRESRYLRLRRHHEPYCSTVQVATSASVGDARLMGEKNGCCGCARMEILISPDFSTKSNAGRTYGLIMHEIDIATDAANPNWTKCHATKF